VLSKEIGEFSNDQWRDKLYTSTIDIKEGVQYRLSLSDSFGDGLSDGNYFALYYGATTDEEYLLARENDFNSFLANIIVTVQNPNPGGPVPVPTSAPTSAPAVSTSPVTTIDIPPSFCFSGQSTVEVQHRGHIPMNQLSVGDMVKTQNSKYERVYSFGHRHESIQAKFLQFFPSMLELSKDHMVFVKKKGVIPASLVKVGDTFAEGGTVEDIRVITRLGIFTPYTPSSTIVVNGVLASNYVAFSDSENLMLGSYETPFSYHWLDHSFQTFHRIWCYWLGFEDQLLESGFSSWSEPAYNIYLAFSEWNIIIQVPLLIMFVNLIALVQVFECLLLYPLSISMVAVLMVYGRISLGTMGKRQSI